MLTVARQAFTAISALLSTAVLGIAAGIVWLVVAMYLRQPPAWYAPVVGILLAWALRATTRAPGITCASVAVLSTLLAALAVNFMLVGMEIAGSMGISVRMALTEAGGGMLWALVRLGMSGVELACYALGLVLAALIAVRRGRKNRG